MLKLLRFLLLLSATCCAVAPAAGVTTEKLLKATVAPGVDIPIEVYWPSQTAQALVVVSPGSGSLADPYFNSELQQAAYRPDHRGGLVDALTAQGYAVAFYSLRGYGRLRDCAHGNSFAARVADFAAHCIDTTLRAKASLATTTADTNAVYAALTQAAETRHLPQIALAFSEGMHHVTLLAGQQRIRPAGIVAVGGPAVSMAELWAYQLRRDFYFQLAQTAFARCPQAVLDIDQLFTCAQVPIQPATRAGMQEFTDATRVTPAVLAMRRHLALSFFQQVQAYYAGDISGKTMQGQLAGVNLGPAWSEDYYAEVLQSNTSTLAQLGAYPGRVIYLTGERDYLLPPATSPAPLALNYHFQTIADVGHGLEDHAGLPPAHALQAIVAAVKAVTP